MTKKWKFIGEITEKWIKDAYPTSNSASVWKYKDRLNSFLEFLNMTDAEYVENYKRSADKNRWAKRMGFKIIAFYNHMLQKGYAVNTARNYASTPRAFSRDVCTPLIVRRGKIAKAKSAKGEHEFNREELAKMFYVADVRGKAVLSTAISLGFSVSDFSELKRDLIEGLVNKSIAEKIDFIGFDYERAKTGVESRSHLTPEAVNSLKAWFDYIDAKRADKDLPKSEWVWCNSNGNHLDKQTLNDVIKDLVTKAQITTTGNVRFHLLRKFLMNAIHDAGFDSWETKRVLGKEIPTSDSTYLQGLSRKVTEKFPTVYDYIRLTGYANKNHTRIEDLEAKIQQLESRLEEMSIENQTLRRIIGIVLPKDKVQSAILQLAEEYNIELPKPKPTSMGDVTVPKSNLDILLEAIKKKQTQKQQSENA